MLIFAPVVLLETVNENKNASNWFGKSHTQNTDQKCKASLKAIRFTTDQCLVHTNLKNCKSYLSPNKTQQIEMSIQFVTRWYLQ